MMTLSHVWMLLCLLAAASTVEVRYPIIGGSEGLTCTCPDHQCQRVYWYRFLQENQTMQFLLKGISTGTAEYAAGIDASRFKASANDVSSKMTYTLRVTGLQKSDAGLYSCMFDSVKRNLTDLMPAGYYIRPGEFRPTSPPPTVKKTKKKPRTCKSNTPPVKGCNPLVLWPSVGVLLVLAVILISTLYYFSRLPKKCRHQFAKKMPLK